MPVAARYVFDSSAVIAFLAKEPGGEVVAALAQDPNSEGTIHSVNVCEVVYDFLKRRDQHTAKQVEVFLAQLSITVVPVFDRPLWLRAASLKATLRRVSFADCVALALSLETEATLVTTDHHELDRVAADGVCPILFIR